LRRDLHAQFGEAGLDNRGETGIILNQKYSHEMPIYTRPVPSIHPVIITTGIGSILGGYVSTSLLYGGRDRNPLEDKCSK
jgi:hypothetical protein